MSWRKTEKVERTCSLHSGFESGTPALHVDSLTVDVTHVQRIMKPVKGGCLPTVGTTAYLKQYCTCLVC